MFKKLTYTLILTGLFLSQTLTPAGAASAKDTQTKNYSLDFGQAVYQVKTSQVQGQAVTYRPTKVLFMLSIRWI